MSHCRFCFVRMLLFPVLMLVGGGGALSAAERFLAQDMNGEQHWNRARTTDRFWREARDAGAFPEGMQADGVYHTNGKTIRTRDVTNTTDAFEGGTLVLEGGVMQVKAGDHTVVKIERLVVRDGSIDASSGLFGGIPQSVVIGSLEQSGVTTFGAIAARGFNLKIGKLSGNGTIRFSGADATSVFNVDIEDASGFTGVFVLDGGTLRVITADGARPIPVLGDTDS